MRCCCCCSFIFLRIMCSHNHPSSENISLQKKKPTHTHANYPTAITNTKLIMPEASTPHMPKHASRTQHTLCCPCLRSCSFLLMHALHSFHLPPDIPQSPHLQHHTSNCHPATALTHPPIAVHPGCAMQCAVNRCVELHSVICTLAQQLLLVAS